MKIIGHCLVRNEEKFIWYAINSVIDYLDELIVWDNGSCDNTISAIQSIKSKKIRFREVEGPVSEIRQQMLEGEDTDWIFILDGDEIWWDDNIGYLMSEIKDTDKDVVVVPNFMLVGDMYHYQEEKAGKYKIAGRIGHYNIRAFRKLKGLHVEGVYPNEAYITKEAVRIQDLSEERILFVESPYLHASFLKRSEKDEKKIKYEMGEAFPLDFYYPEVFFKVRPRLVPCVWQPMGLVYKYWAMFQTPLKKIKRRIL